MSTAARRVLEALLDSVDEARLEAALGLGRTDATADATPDATRHSVLHERLLLNDILGDDILGARAGDPSFPIRVFLSKLGEPLAQQGDAFDSAFALATGLSFYFRAVMDEEARVRVGIEVSRLYYAFASAHLEDAERREVSPLLARLMGTELERVRFEAVDVAPVFDSSVHERGVRANKTASALVRPETFLCRVAGNGMVRFKAVVET